MAATEQDYNDIIEQVDELDEEQTREFAEYLENTTDSPGTVMKWLLRKLREYAYPS